MKEIVIISGKGGTGKTTVTAALGTVAGKEAIIADCDVDAADMHLLMEPDFGEAHDFSSGHEARIIAQSCSNCGKCLDVCHFDAIFPGNESCRIDPISCEGCGYCSIICPEKAIQLFVPKTGIWYRSNMKTGSQMVHARLRTGADNSEKLVARVKNEARSLAEKYHTQYVLVDGSPGIGCPVVSSLSGAAYVLLVTEPTVSGYHDLMRVVDLLKHFRLQAGCVLNKADLNKEQSERIEDSLKEKGIPVLACLPYDPVFSEAIRAGKTIPEMGEKKLRLVFEDIWTSIKQVINN